MRALVLMFACLGFVQIRPASAETLRCGSSLIEPGDDAGYVLEKCGEPNSSPAFTGPVLARGSGIYYISGDVSHAGRWRYERGPGKFPAVLTIGDDGRVVSIQFEKHPE